MKEGVESGVEGVRLVVGGDGGGDRGVAQGGAQVHLWVH